jgi:hypothetical protein
MGKWSWLEINKQPFAHDRPGVVAMTEAQWSFNGRVAAIVP